jgi:hypothetical protein
MNIKILSDKEIAARGGEAQCVPVYRVKGNHRRLMGWAERTEALRGAIEIRFGDDETEVVYSKSDA